MTKLSDNLFQLRKLHNLTQEQVAAELGVSRQAVAKWETGETTPDLSNCLALAQFYDVSLDDLVRALTPPRPVCPSRPRGSTASVRSPSRRTVRFSSPNVPRTSSASNLAPPSCCWGMRNEGWRS